MGFWSKLTKGLAIGGAGLGTILTAGAASPALAGALGIGGGTAALGGAAASAGSGLLSKIGKGISAASQIAGPMASGVAAGAQKGREAENTAAQNAANFQLKEREQNEAALENRAGVDLKQRQFGQDSQNNAYRNALRSALAKNMQDVSINTPAGIPKFAVSGGLRPSALGPEGKAAADLMNQKAMASLMSGEKFDPMAPIERTAVPTFKTPGTLENVAGAIGLGANAINGANAQSQQSGFQQKIMDALKRISGTGAVSVGSPLGAAPMDPTGGDDSNR